MPHQPCDNIQPLSKNNLAFHQQHPNQNSPLLFIVTAEEGFKLAKGDGLAPWCSEAHLQRDCAKARRFVHIAGTVIYSAGAELRQSKRRYGRHAGTGPEQRWICGSTPDSARQ